jgi:hypothetical protein
LVRVYKAGAPAAQVVARTIRQSLSSMLVDIELYDASGALVLSAENARLVEAPGELVADSRSLSYRMSEWRHDRPGQRSLLVPPTIRVPASRAEASPLGEAVLLIEAGCLRATWNALSAHLESAVVAESDTRTSDEESTDGASAQDNWQPYYRAALFWHLEGKGLAVERAGRRILAATCDLPDVNSIVKSLVLRHPLMIAEIASLARIDEFLGRLGRGHKEAGEGFSRSHWRHLGSAVAVLVGPEGSLDYLATTGEGAERTYQEVADASAEQVLELIRRTLLASSRV